MWKDEFAGQFEEMTTPKVASFIDSQFSAEAALEIKREWAIHHLDMMAKANRITAAKDALAVAGLEPTGLVNVINAYTHPRCTALPFPSVNPRF